VVVEGGGGDVELGGEEVVGVRWRPSTVIKGGVCGGGLSRAIGATGTGGGDGDADPTQSRRRWTHADRWWVTRRGVGRSF
jgi:hypothetical protein